MTVRAAFVVITTTYQQGKAVIDIAANEKTTAADAGHGISFSEAFRVWLRVALLSFGGPAGQIAMMHRILVEEKNWISESRFLHALNYCMLLPGPEAQQLATYTGWLLHRTAGGIMAGGLFILPGIIAIMGLSYVYAAFGHVGVVEALFFGLKAAVLAIVIQAVVRVGSRALRNRVMIALAGVAFIAIFFFNVPFPLIVIAAGVIGYLGARRGWPEFAALPHGGKNAAVADSLAAGEQLPDHVRPSVPRALIVAAVWLPLWLVPVGALLIAFGEANVFSQIALFFSKMAMVTFGGAYAVLAYVAQQAVNHYHWLSPREMLDGLGMAETTPGPLIMVLQFVGFMAAYRDPGTLSPMLAGTLGGLLATWVTFTPCFLWIFVGAPFIETLRGNKALAGALGAITAAVVGVILNLSIWFALHTVFQETSPVRSLGLSFDRPVLSSVDFPALALALAAAVAVFRFDMGMLTVLAGSCVAGVSLRLAGLI
jgi:chromate transporter